MTEAEKDDILEEIRLLRNWAEFYDRHNLEQYDRAELPRIVFNLLSKEYDAYIDIIY